MNDPVVTIKETDFGNLYTKVRDIKSSDFKIKNDLPYELNINDYTEDSYIYPCFEMRIKGDILEESLIIFNEKSSWRSSAGKPRNTFTFYSDYINFDWRGCRNIAGKVSKYNRHIVKGITKVMKDYEKFIQDGIININYQFKTFIENENQKTLRKAKGTYLNIKSYDKKWLEEVDDPNNTSNLEILKKEYESIKEKISNLEEEIRIRRVEQVKESFQKNDCKQDPEIVEFLIKKMDDKKALEQRWS